MSYGQHARELMADTRRMLTGARGLWFCTCPPLITCSTSTALARPKPTTFMSMSVVWWAMRGVDGTHAGLSRGIDRVLGALDKAGCAVGLTADHGMNDKV